MRWGLLATFIALLARPAVGQASPDAGATAPKGAPGPNVVSPKGAPDAGVSEDELLAADLELLENLEVIERLEQYDLEDR